jgi:hypothetical protein
LAAISAVMFGDVGASHADVLISQSATANMACSQGVCTPTAAAAVLNVGDLENFLALGNVSVTTAGTGVQAKDIIIDAQFSWSSANGLMLSAERSIIINRLVGVDGASSLALNNGSNGRLSFGSKGRIAFQSLTSGLMINDVSYQLVSDIGSMASAIATGPAGSYALADNYNASGDGKYRSTPIETVLEGTVQGLGNTISDFRASFKNKFGDNAMFYEIGTSGAVENLRLSHEKLELNGESGAGAGLVDVNLGTLSGDTVEGSIAGSCCAVGGIAEGNIGTIEHSNARMNITAGVGAGGVAGENLGYIQFSNSSGSIQAEGQWSGGLTEENEGTINESYSTMNVTGSDNTYLGGISGYDKGETFNSYASGSITGGERSFVGGFDGVGDGAIITASYSTGSVSGGQGASIGGFIGANNPVQMTHCYWDTTTSGADEGVGVGGTGGLTGMTTDQLQSGLPTGFKARVWSEEFNIDDGLPFLKADRP